MQTKLKWIISARRNKAILLSLKTMPMEVENSNYLVIDSVITSFTLPLVGNSPSVLRHAICFLNQWKRSAYREIVSDVNVSKHDSPDFYIATCDERHSACSMCGKGDMFDDLAQHKARLRKVEMEKQMLLQDISQLNEELGPRLGVCSIRQ